jgi:hypothetical protein
MNLRVIITIFGLVCGTGLLTGCPWSTTNEHLANVDSNSTEIAARMKNLDESARRLAEAIERLEKTGSSFMRQVLDRLMKPPPAAKSQPIESTVQPGVDPNNPPPPLPIQKDPENGGDQPEGN